MTILEFAEVRVRTRPGGTAVPPAETRPPRRSRGTFLLPPWSRAPMLAFRHPAVVLAVVAAAAILSCATSSASLFLSSSSSEALHRILAGRCGDASFPAVNVAPEPTVTFDPATFSNRISRLPDLAGVERDAPAAMTAAGLPAPIRTIKVHGSNAFPAAIHNGTVQPMRLFYGDGATRNIDVMSRIGGNGLMLSSNGATILSAKPGDSITFGGVPVKVVGVYRNLFDAPLPSYWCSYSGDLGLVPCQLCGQDPPPLGIFTDPNSFDRLYRQLALSGGTTGTLDYQWISPVRTAHLTLSGAHRIIGQQEASYRTLGLRTGDQTSHAFNQSQLPAMAGEAGRIRDGLHGPVVPIALGGALLALLLVGAAGSYWADRRAREVRLLSSRGVGPAGLALKAALELTLPAVIGTVLGWLLARWLVATLGPSPDLDPAAPRDAALTAAAGLVAGVLLLSAVAGMRARNATERPVGARRSWAALVPWELLILAAAGLCYLRLDHERAVVVDQGVAQVNLLLVATPLLFLLGSAILVVRLLTGLLGPLRRRSHRWPVPLYLAVSRLTSARVVSVTLLAALAMPVAMVVYSAGITKTSQYTVDAKSRVFIGGASSVVSVDRAHRSPALDRVATMVDRYEGAHLGAGGAGGTEVTVLAVDPGTLPRFAFWDDRFADRPLRALMSDLSGPVRDGRVPALLIGAKPGTDTSSVQVGDSTVPLRIADRPRVFPGTHSPDPLVVISARALGDRGTGASRFTEYWSPQNLPTLERVLTRLNVRVFVTHTPEQVQEVANFLAVTWSFGYLEALAALVGLIAIGGLLLYLETRARSRAASYALGQRMGLTGRRHLLSMLIEMGMVLGAALVVGSALAWAAVLPVYGRIDIDTTRPPGPLLTVPVADLVGAGVASCLVAVAAAAYAHRSARRTDVAEVLRLGA